MRERPIGCAVWIVAIAIGCGFGFFVAQCFNVRTGVFTGFIIGAGIVAINWADRP